MIEPTLKALRRLSRTTWMGKRGRARSAAISRWRSRWIVPASLGCVLSLSGCGGSDERPNLLLITVDSLRRDILEDYGARAIFPFPPLMSNTDRLMDRSTVLLNCYTVAPRTTQSLASVITGQYPSNSGTFGVFHTLPETATTLAEVLRDEGYSTHAVVTSFFLQRGRGFEQGFAAYDDTLFHRAADYAEFVTDRAELMSAQTFEEPYFLWVHFTDPSWPYTPPQQILDALHSDYAGQFSLYEDIDSSRVTRGEVIFEEDAVSEEDRRHLQRRYLAEAMYVDGHIGRLVGLLQSRGQLDNTLTVFCADQGESMGEQGYFFAHGETLYQPTVAVPAFFNYPGRLDRKLVESVSSLVDFAPTILDLLGVEHPNPEIVDGVSLAPVIEGTGDAPRDVAFIESGYQLIHAENPRFHHMSPEGKWRAVVTEDYKLIRIPTESGSEWELYDLRQDPGETVNLYEGKPAVVDALEVPLADWEAIVDRQASMQTSVHEETSRDLRERGYLN